MPGLSDQIRENDQRIQDLAESNKTYIQALEEMRLEGQENTEAFDQLTQHMERTADEYYRLEEANRALKQEAQAAAQEGIAELTKELDANREAQEKALEAMKEATSEMIFTKASKGLDTEATIALAHAMGILSEEDYAVIASIEELRAQHDLNRDGMIDASEGAYEYAAKIKELNDAVISLKEEEMPVTFETIANAMNIARDSSDDLAGSVNDLRAALVSLHSIEGVSAGGVDMSAPSYPTGPTGIYSAAGTYGGAGVSVDVALSYNNYGVSLADEYELEQLLRPIILRIVGTQ